MQTVSAVSSGAKRSRSGGWPIADHEVDLTSHKAAHQFALGLHRTLVDDDSGRGLSKEFGNAPHTDYGFITILLQVDVGGLEVRRVGGGGIKAMPAPGAFVVNVADILSCWTNGRWQSTPHRVQSKNNVDRYSGPFFFDPDMAATIECLPVCVLAGEPPRFEPVVYGDYLIERIDKNYDYRKTRPAANRRLVNDSGGVSTFCFRIERSIS